jgi:ribA/ribD-fused uncharacterized protein
VVFLTSTAYNNTKGELKMIDRFKNEYRFLSNFWILDNPVIIDGLVFDNTEAAYQAMKTLDSEIRSEFQELNPSEAKKKGRNVKLREDWENIKIKIMTEIVRQKFENNPHLGYMLIDTYPKQLVEGNWWGDTFWGVDMKNHAGQNHLGKILMKIRDELREKQ